VGRVNSDGGAAPGYFKLQPHTPGAAAEVLVVAFGSAPGVPNWGKLLDLVAGHVPVAPEHIDADQCALRSQRSMSDSTPERGNP